MTLLKLFDEKKNSQPLCWIMRQAGRYLPEYRALRANARSFLDLCLTPSAAAEITLQPLKRFDLDAAIIFSDILIVPYALGLNLTFIEGQGPHLDRIEATTSLSRLTLREDRFGPTCEAISLVRAALSPSVNLIGFAGAPWTVACYMLEGQSSKSFDRAKAFAFRHPQAFQDLLKIITEATIVYLIRQVEAGAQVLQLFESWGEAVPDRLVNQAIYQPTQAIVKALKTAFPHVPIIGFPRGLGEKTKEYQEKTNVDGVGLDSRISLEWVKKNFTHEVVLQGGIDPQVLVAGGDILRQEVERYRTLQAQGPYIFNLGHGIVPETPIDHVADFIHLVKEA
ncbi:MAG: uroporphyrinogen decarboxylase [Candidatus Paracaedimonas acanthamoebae]|uniref:Uroporphyrinogen decarboxylase n=1 Tax=Candidatus Paracaedimonas acanthamoebae TaxID=244581 RepID=A0A8J7PWQ2_9PROT|nr:uroporphyrinogen decarboxylase [Candidatus Paracaedimonas acanthamoebae]